MQAKHFCALTTKTRAKMFCLTIVKQNITSLSLLVGRTVVPLDSPAWAFISILTCFDRLMFQEGNRETICLAHLAFFY